MKQIKILFLLILLLIVFSSQSFSIEAALFNADFFKENQEYYETTQIKETCYKLLMMPEGAGKLFASKYKNYYFFTDEPPHYFIKYYNDFIPLVTEVETTPGL